MIVIKNANIHTMMDVDYENGMVFIDDSKIIDVGENLTIPSNATVIDAKGGFLMPGIIDAHCHVGILEDSVGFEGDDVNEVTDPSTPHLRALDGINPNDKCFEEALQGGVTTVSTGPGSANVIGGQFVIMKTFGKTLNKMIINDCSAMKVAFGENPKRVYSSFEKCPSTRMATAAIFRENLIKAKNYIQMKNRAINDSTKMPEFDIKLEALSKVINKEIPIKAHAHRADDILTALRIAKEFDLDISLDHCTEGHLIIDSLTEENFKGAIVGPTLSSRSKVELKNLTFKTPAILNNAGINIALMTDHPVIPLQYLSICAALASREGLGDKSALKAITINPAKILNIDNRLGSITKGKDADILIYNGHPFDLRNKLNFIMVNGDIVKNEL